MKIIGNSNRAEGPLVSCTSRLTARPGHCVCMHGHIAMARSLPLHAGRRYRLPASRLSATRTTPLPYPLLPSIFLSLSASSKPHQSSSRCCPNSGCQLLSPWVPLLYSSSPAQRRSGCSNSALPLLPHLHQQRRPSETIQHLLPWCPCHLLPFQPPAPIEATTCLPTLCVLLYLFPAASCD
jgi:hypothetical protein